MTRPLLPTGFTLSLDRSTRIGPTGAVLWGGVPWRALRLTEAGANEFALLRAGKPVEAGRSGALARRLVDAGLAHPRPPRRADTTDLVVIVPVRDRADVLDRCLTALAGLDVTVVDDGSADPAAVAAVAAAHGARVVRRDVSGGPAAARNSGLAATRRPLVAFVDSDCAVDAEALLRVAGHLADPSVGAAAPRIVESVDNTHAPTSPLDLGAHEALVQPGARVSYVPTTAVVVRRTAVDAVDGFDERLRYGEDVDLVWRLVDAGWSVRYDPSVVAHHVAPRSWSARLNRRYLYGTSAGPLARRHGAATSGPALSGFVAPVRMRTVQRAGIPAGEAARLVFAAPLHTAAAMLRWALPLHADAASVIDDMAYQCGVLRGCVSARTARPLLPTVRGRQGRIG